MDVVDLTADSPLPPYLGEAAAGPHESDHAIPGDNDMDGVLCDQCQQLVPLQDWDSHSVAHELEQQEPRPQQRDKESADAALAAALAAEQQEPRPQREHESADAALAAALAAADGSGSHPQRAGSCFLCGIGGHYARECPQAPDNIEAAKRRLHAPTPATVAAAQRPDKCVAVDGGLLPLLAGVLERQALPPRTRYSALLCGPLEHYQAQAFDAGWGCGYRNIQVQLSHLLLTREVGPARGL